MKARKALNRREFLKTLGIIGAASGGLVALAGCTGATPPPSEQVAGAAEEATTAPPQQTGQRLEVDFLFPGWAPEDILVLEESAQRFMEAYPDIQVVPVQATGSASEKLATMIAGGTPPSIAWHSGHYPFYMTEGSLVSLDDYIAGDASGVLTPDMFFEEAWETGQYEGRTYGIPYGVQTFVIYANLNLFDEAGIDLPDDDNWTFDDLIETARALTRKDDDPRKTVWGLNLHSAGFTWVACGGDRTNEDYTEATVNNPQTRQIMQMVRDSWEKHEVAPPPDLVQEGGGDLPMFQTGRTAIMAVLSRWRAQYRDGIKDFEWDVLKYPWQVGEGFEKTRRSALEVEFMAITQGGKNPDQAWEYLKWLCSKENSAYQAKKGTVIPAYKEIAESDDFLWNPPKTPQRYLDSLPFSVFRFYKHNTVKDLMLPEAEFYGNFVTSVPQMWPVEEGLQWLEDEMQKILDDWHAGKAS